uniref:Ig-like domain-containing protein n=1 Tax=Rhabditophanes sp. KR3021 TaxID=114890 RepID=A0AC35TY35_9BILA
MPSAPRFIQKPSIQQTPTGDLLMECSLEADPIPTITWQHSGNPITAGGRVTLELNLITGSQYKAILLIKEPNAGDGGTYKCTSSNQLGESNANINLNFAGGGDDKPPSKGPIFVGKPCIIPKDGGALILMECKVKSPTKPTARWSKDGVALSIGGLYQDVFTDLGDGIYVCQLEIRKPSAGDAGQYRCNIKNDQGETNANLSLNFEQEEPPEPKPRSKRSPSKDSKSRDPSRPGTPHRKRSEKEKAERAERNKSREGTPRKSTRTSRTATPTKEIAIKEQQEKEKMDVDGLSAKRRSDAPLPPKEKRSRQRSSSPIAPEMAGQAAAHAAAVDSTKKAPVVLEPIKPMVSQILCATPFTSCSSHYIHVVTIGQSCLLQCLFQCHQTTKVSWFRDEKLIEATEQSQSFNGSVAQLSISRFSENKAGRYKAVASSEYGQIETTAIIRCQEEKKDEKKDEKKKDEKKKDEKKEEVDLLTPDRNRDKRSSSRKSSAGKNELEAVTAGLKRRSHSKSPSVGVEDIPKKSVKTENGEDKSIRKSKSPARLVELKKSASPSRLVELKKASSPSPARDLKKELSPVPRSTLKSVTKEKTPTPSSRSSSRRGTATSTKDDKSVAEDVRLILNFPK